MQFSDVPVIINSLTIVYMQSYSQMWINSTLQIDCIFYNPSFYVSTDSLEEIDLIALGHNETSGMVNRTDSYTSISHVISGYHDDKTSILVPIKLPLPDRTLDEGESALQLRFRLLDGRTFKIAGMALC
jgi:hypothetical protein